MAKYQVIYRKLFIEQRKENRRLLAANKDCIRHFDALKQDYDSLKQDYEALKNNSSKQDVR